MLLGSWTRLSHWGQQSGRKGYFSIGVSAAYLDVIAEMTSTMFDTKIEELQSSQGQVHAPPVRD